MRRQDYEQLRQELEEQHRAEVELLEQAHRVRIRALESVWRAASSADGDGKTHLVPPPAPPPAAERSPEPAKPPRRARAWQVQDAVEEALERVGEVFDRADLIAALGFQPQRSTFYRAMEQLRQDGAIEVVEPGSGSHRTTYRKLSAAPSGNR